MLVSRRIEVSVGVVTAPAAPGAPGAPAAPLVVSGVPTDGDGYRDGDGDGEGDGVTAAPAAPAPPVELVSDMPPCSLRTRMWRDDRAPALVLSLALPETPVVSRPPAVGALRLEVSCGGVVCCAEAVAALPSVSAAATPSAHVTANFEVIPSSQRLARKGQPRGRTRSGCRRSQPGSLRSTGRRGITRRADPCACEARWAPSEAGCAPRARAGGPARRHRRGTARRCAFRMPQGVPPRDSSAGAAELCRARVRHAAASGTEIAFSVTAGAADPWGPTLPARSPATRVGGSGGGAATRSMYASVRMIPHKSVHNKDLRRISGNAILTPARGWTAPGAARTGRISGLQTTSRVALTADEWWCGARGEPVRQTTSPHANLLEPPTAPHRTGAARRAAARHRPTKPPRPR